MKENIKGIGLKGMLPKLGDVCIRLTTSHKITTYTLIHRWVLFYYSGF